MIDEQGLCVVAYGLGVNSTAMLCGMRDRGWVPDLILFADTGGERPGSYAYLQTMQQWLLENSFPAIVVVKNDGVYGSLEKNCLETKTLPSLAYGWKSCSDKYKKRPQDKYVGMWPPARMVWRAGGLVTKCIGYDADEDHRPSTTGDNRYKYRYPLREWEWGRDDCIRAIVSAGLPVPPKSSCFFCPAMKKHEINQLKADHPRLLDRAIAIEDNAASGLVTVRGLGRYFGWREFVDGKASLPMASDPPDAEIPCGCYDGA